MISHLCANDFVLKYCKVADVNDEETLAGFFIESVDTSVCHSDRLYWALDAQAEISNIKLQAQRLRFIRKEMISSQTTTKEAPTGADLHIKDLREISVG